MMLRFACFFLIASFTGCLGQKTQKNRVLLVNGGGASFPYILYSKWLSEYRRVQPSVAVNYQSIGSGGGIRQFLKGTLDFGGTDVPVSPEELKKTKKRIIHIPTALGAVVITYNLDFSGGEALYLDGETLSQIFMGKIEAWNHPSIQKLNKKIKLPKEPIVVIYRADGSGTTSFFTEYLSLVSKDFLSKVGKGKAVSWPVGIGGKGNEGVMGLVNKMKGSIAYIGGSYAAAQNLSLAKIKNRAGYFVSADIQSVKSAADYIMKSKKTIELL